MLATMSRQMLPLAGAAAALLLAALWALLPRSEDRQEGPPRGSGAGRTPQPATPELHRTASTAPGLLPGTDSAGEPAYTAPVLPAPVIPAVPAQEEAAPSLNPQPKRKGPKAGKKEDPMNMIVIPPPPATGNAPPVHGTREPDHIQGSEGSDTIHGGTGDDLIEGGPGDDWIDGETGDDIIYGGPGNDTLQGGDGDNYLDGGPGDDWLHAEHGIDTLRGGPGADTLRGGGDADVFLYEAGDAEGGMDRIEDFNPAEGDVLVLTGLLASLGYRGDGSAASLAPFLRMNGTVLEISSNGREFRPLVDLKQAHTLEALVTGGNLRATAPDSRP